MDPKEFTEAAPGQLREIHGGPTGARWAFIPDPLPPNWDWPERLWPMLVEARTALATLDGTGKHLPNPDIVMTPLQVREAQLSSKLEGTVTDPQRQLLFQEDPKHPVSSGDPNNSYQEVFNYRKALRLKLDGETNLPLSLRLIRRLHEILMRGVRGDDQTPGEFRKIHNQIGRPARFVPPPPDELNDALYAFESYLHEETPAYDPLVRAFIAHYQFEAIHPFRDGNGRVGRLLLAIKIAEWCGLSNQWLYMSAYFERHKQEYMDRLLRVSTHGDWESWVEFCLLGVIAQANDTQMRCEQLMTLHRSFHDRIKRMRGGSVRLAGLVDNLFVSPAVTVKAVKNMCGVTYPTAKADLKKLESLRILAPLDGLHLKAFYCRQIYEIAYEGVDD